MKKLFARAAASLSGRYRTMSIQMVISLSFTAAAVAGMVLMGLSLVWRYSAGTEQLVRENTERVLGQVNMNMDSYLRRMMRVSDTMYYRIIKNADLATQSLDEGMELLYEENRDELVSIAVFDSRGALVAGTPLTALKEGADPASSDWYQAALDKMENLHFSTPHIQRLFADPDENFRWVVSLSRYVQLTREGSTYSGVLLVDMGFSGIEQVCRDVELAGGGYIYLTDAAGELIYHPRQQLIYAGLDTENNLAAASLADGTHTETFQGERRLVTVKTVGYTGWKLVGVVPRTGAGDDGGYIFLFGLSMLLFSAFLMAFLNFRISARISDPIRRLEQSVKELEAGAQEVAIKEDGCYEVRRLAHSIASMVSTMRHLMDDIILQEKRKRRSELEVLQSQINPHFLYNTLDSVIWMTEAGRYDEAIQMVTSLARLFRIALSRGRSFIPLADELEHALKLIVQPLLENAIYHGMAGCEEDGRITVTAKRDGGDLVIDVSDNGVGMPPEVVERLLDESRPQTRSSGSGIGVRNVHRRIRLTFGEGYGLEVFSEPDEGTTVRIRLPALTAEEAAQLQREEEP